MDEKFLRQVASDMADAEKILNEIDDDNSENVRQLRAQLTAKFRDVKERLIDAEEIVRDKAKDAARSTDEYVRENPWKVIGAGAGLAFLLGMLVSRR